MNAIAAREIKRRGIAAVDDLIENGDLHVIRNDQPQYVCLLLHISEPTRRRGNS